MQTLNIVVSIIHILLAIILIIVILLQSSKRTGLSGSIAGASETFFGKNQVRTVDHLLSKWTGICAIAFLITSLYLAYSFTINKGNATQQSGQPATQQTASPAQKSAQPAASGAPAVKPSAPAVSSAPNQAATSAPAAQASSKPAG